MAARPGPARTELVEMLAELTGRPATEVPERIGSMELAWLVHLVEQRYDTHLDLTDDQLAAIGTVDDAQDAFRACLSAADG